MAEGTPLRCAIYTRKSTEEGLEQAFNTLQAQRESAEAYIASQRHCGWTAVDQRYDDGGYSGGSLERPAMKRLLDDVAGGRVNCVVVYKVDRLSRSLLDFSRLMALFERQGVSFVSVTQEFNTTTSLGRLTLNILLSFAQFEREIISERTRDKASAARRKGKWIGGSPVLGYDVDARGGRLVVNPTEAAQVQAMFQIAAEAGSLQATLVEVQQRGLRTKSWTSAAGRHHGGGPFFKNTLRALLGNVVYTGVISNKGTIWPGEQEAIVDAALWEQVNRQLQDKARCQRGRAHHRQEPLLKGMLNCDCGSQMIATYTRRRGRQYRYYVCQKAKQGRRTGAHGRPVAADELEAVLIRQVGLMGLEASSELELRKRVERVIWAGQNRQLTIEFRDGSRQPVMLADARREERPSGESAAEEGRVPRISRLMALALQLEQDRMEGRFRDWAEIARLGQISRARLSHISGLLNLAPEIQETLLYLPKTQAGTDRLTERSLRGIAGLADWDEQRQQFRELLFSTQR